jgi:ABC-type maltose transport system permease subunit
LPWYAWNAERVCMEIAVYNTAHATVHSGALSRARFKGRKSRLL